MAVSVSWWKLPYYWAGCKAYDLLAYLSGDALSQSYFLSKSKALEAFPMLKAQDLKAALVYYDGKSSVLVRLYPGLKRLTIAF